MVKIPPLLRIVASGACFAIGGYAALLIPGDDAHRVLVKLIVFFAVWIGVFKFVDSVFELGK